MKLSFSITLFLSCTAWAWGQPAVQSTSKDTFRILATTPNPIMGLLYDIKGKPIITNAFTGDITRIYKLPPGQILEFYIPGPPAIDDTENKPTKKIMAQVSISGIEGPLLIALSPSPKGSPIPYVGACRNISLESQPNNSVLFTNLSQFKVAANFYNQIFSLDKQQVKLISFNGSDGKTSLSLALFKGSNWDPIGETTVPIQKNSRTMVFYFNASAPNGELMGINCVVVKDGSPPPEEKPSNTN